MAKSIEWPQQQRRSPQFRRYLLLFLVLFFGIIVFGRAWLSYYVDALWFHSLGYGEVFWKTLSLRGTVFAAFAAASFVILYGAFLALKRVSGSGLPGSHTIFIGPQPVTLPVDSVL